MSSLQEPAAAAASADPADSVVAAPDPPPETFMEALSKATKDDQPKSVLWIVSLLLALFALGVHDFLTNHEVNGCAMTYMYEMPTYLPVPDPDSIEKRFPKYRLFAYAEGEDYIRTVSAGDFFGIPVLFIPGNSGSYKQVRSLASVALRKAYEPDVGGKFHFDYFTIDFNEEFSALYGGSLDDQAEFAAQCINRILKLYEQDKNSPKSVVLVGHSIGGLVARAVFLSPKFDANKVNTIVTLATPHQPVIVMDSYTRAFYDGVDRFWNLTRAKTLKDIVFVSIGGGERDIQVRSGLAMSPHADVNVVSTDVPAVWVSTDHQCIAWCKQLVIAVNRALFDTVHKETSQITTKIEHRRRVFKYHFVHKSAGNRFKAKDMFPKTMEFDKDGFWSDSLKRQFVFMRDLVAQNSHIMIRIFDDPKHEIVTIDALNFDHDNWLFGCKATTVYMNTRICETGDNLSHKTRIVPSNGKRKTVRMNLHDLGEKFNYTHLLVYIPKKSEQIKVNIDVYNEKERNFAFEVPRFISFWKSYTIVQQTHPTSVFYNISLQGIESPWQAYDIRVSAINKCDDSNHFGMMRFVTPWVHDTTQTLIGFNMTNKLTAKLQMPKPEDGRYYRNPEMLIHLNPSCQYRIEIQSSINQMWGQMVRFYAPLLLPLCVAAVLLTVAQQMKLMHTEGNFPSFTSVIANRVSPISVVMPSRILSSVVSMGFVAKLLPINDLQRIADQGIDFGVLPIVLFFVSIGMVTVVSSSAWFTVVAIGSLARKTVMKLLPLRTHHIMEDVSKVSKFPFILSGLLIALATATCGTIALCLGTFCHFLQMFYLYQGCTKVQEEVTELERKKESQRSSSENFQFSMLLLWASATVLNVPSLLAWTRNLSFVPNLQPDPSLVVSVVLSASLAVTFGGKAPKQGLGLYDRLSMLIQFLCVLIVLYGSVSVYRVNYYLSAALMAIVIHQAFAPEKSVEDAKAGTEDNTISKKEVKTSQNGSDLNESPVSRYISSILQSFLILVFDFEAVLYMSAVTTAHYVGIILLYAESQLKLRSNSDALLLVPVEARETVRTDYDFEHHLPDIVRRSRQQAAVATEQKPEESIRFAGPKLFCTVVSHLQNWFPSLKSVLTEKLPAVFRHIAEFTREFINAQSVTLYQPLGFVRSSVIAATIQLKGIFKIRQPRESYEVTVAHLAREESESQVATNMPLVESCSLLQECEDAGKRHAKAPLSGERDERMTFLNMTTPVFPKQEIREKEKDILVHTVDKIGFIGYASHFLLNFITDVAQSLVKATFFVKSYFIYPYPYLLIEWLRQTFLNITVQIAQFQKTRLKGAPDMKESYLQETETTPKKSQRIVLFSAKVQSLRIVTHDVLNFSSLFIVEFVLNVKCSVLTSVFFFKTYFIMWLKWLKTYLLGIVKVHEFAQSQSETEIRALTVTEKQSRKVDPEVGDSLPSKKRSILRNVARESTKSFIMFLVTFVKDLKSSIVTSMLFLKVCFIHPYPYCATIWLKKFISERNLTCYGQFPSCQLLIQPASRLLLHFFNDLKSRIKSSLRYSKSRMMMAWQHFSQYVSMLVTGFFSDLISCIATIFLFIKHYTLLPFNAQIFPKFGIYFNSQPAVEITNVKLDILEQSTNIMSKTVEKKCPKEKKNWMNCASAIKQIPVCFVSDLQSAISTASRAFFYYFLYPVPYLGLLRMLQLVPSRILPNYHPTKDRDNVNLLLSEASEIVNNADTRLLQSTDIGEGDPPEEIIIRSNVLPSKRGGVSTTMQKNFGVVRKLFNIPNIFILRTRLQVCTQFTLTGLEKVVANFVLRFGQDLHSVLLYLKNFIIYYLLFPFPSLLLEYLNTSKNCAYLQHITMEFLKIACYSGIRSWHVVMTILHIFWKFWKKILKSEQSHTNFGDITNDHQGSNEQRAPVKDDLRQSQEAQEQKKHLKEAKGILKVNKKECDLLYEASKASQPGDIEIKSSSKPIEFSIKDQELVDKHIGTQISMKGWQTAEYDQVNINYIANDNDRDITYIERTIQLTPQRAQKDSNTEDNEMDPARETATEGIKLMPKLEFREMEIMQSDEFCDANSQVVLEDILWLRDLAQQKQELELTADLERLLKQLEFAKSEGVVAAKEFAREFDDFTKDKICSLPKEYKLDDIKQNNPLLIRNISESQITKKKVEDMAEVLALFKELQIHKSKQEKGTISTASPLKECLRKQIEENTNFKIISDLLQLSKQEEISEMNEFDERILRANALTFLDDAEKVKFNKNRHKHILPIDVIEQSDQGLGSKSKSMLDEPINELKCISQLQAVEEIKPIHKTFSDQAIQIQQLPQMRECNFKTVEKKENVETDRKDCRNRKIEEANIIDIYHNSEGRRATLVLKEHLRTEAEPKEEEASCVEDSNNEELSTDYEAKCVLGNSSKDNYNSDFLIGQSYIGVVADQSSDEQKTTRTFSADEIISTSGSLQGKSHQYARHPEIILGKTFDHESCSFDAARLDKDKLNWFPYFNEDITCLKKLAYQTLAPGDQFEATNPGLQDNWEAVNQQVIIPERPKRNKTSHGIQKQHKLEETNLHESLNLLFEKMPVDEELCIEKITYTCGQFKTIDDNNFLKPVEMHKKREIVSREKKISNIQENRENSYFQNIAFTRPAFTYVIDKGKKVDSSNVAGIVKPVDSDDSDQEQSLSEIDFSKKKDEELSDAANLGIVRNCLKTAAYKAGVQDNDDQLFHKIGTQSESALDMRKQSSTFPVSGGEDFSRSQTVVPTSDKAMSPLHSEMFRAESSTQTEFDLDNSPKYIRVAQNVQSSNRINSISKGTYCVQDSPTDLTFPKAHGKTSKRPTADEHFATAKVDSDMEYIFEDDSKFDDVFDDEADDELMHRIDQKLYSLQNRRHVSIKSEAIEEFLTSSDDEEEHDRIRLPSQDNATSRDAKKLQSSITNQNNEPQERNFKSLGKKMIHNMGKETESVPVEKSGKDIETSTMLRKDSRNSDARNKGNFMGEVAIDAKLESGRSRSTVAVKRSASSIDISIALSDVDCKGSSRADTDNWEVFAKAVRDTTATFERKLFELSNRFNQALDESKLGLSEEDLFGVPEPGQDWDSDWDESKEEVDVDRRAFSALEDQRRQRQHTLQKQDELRFGATSSLADYRRSDQIPSPHYERPFRYSSRHRDKSEDEEDNDPKPRVSRHDAHLARTHSVKQTALERLRYTCSSGSSGRVSNSPYRYRPTPPLRPRSVDPIGFTRSQYFTYHPSSPIYSSLDTSRDREMMSQLDKESLDRRKLTRSLRVENLKPEWRRSTIHTSQPYSPVKNYHRQRSRAMERRGVHDYPGSYRRSLESLEGEPLDGDVSGAMALAKYYREPKLVHTRKGNRVSLN